MIKLDDFPSFATLAVFILEAKFSVRTRVSFTPAPRFCRTQTRRPGTPEWDSKCQFMLAEDHMEEVTWERRSSPDRYQDPATALNEQLHSACSDGNVDVVRSLLLSGADGAARDQSSNTCLHISAMFDYGQVLKILLVRSPHATPPKSSDTFAPCIGSRGPDVCAVFQQRQLRSNRASNFFIPLTQLRLSTRNATYPAGR